MITLGHGAGGRLSHRLLEDLILPAFNNSILKDLCDSAVLGDIAFTTDSYVVTPRFFPGGDIGRLAVCGTINDLSMVGAEPIGLSAAFIIEEGFAMSELKQITASMAETAEQAAVKIVTGDTKVVPRGACDGIFINTSGVGRLRPEFRPTPTRVVPGDAVIVSGTIGNHGMAVMACREGITMKGDLQSDVAPLSGVVGSLLRAGVTVHALRDPTRGGIAQSLIEISMAAKVRIAIEETALPLKPSVAAACDLLGLDPLYVANEGILLALVHPDHLDRTLQTLRKEPLARDATHIGFVESGPVGLELITTIGARRAIRMPEGELLPRIC